MSTYRWADEAKWIIVGDEAYTPEEWAAIPHGTRTGYTGHGCRCDECREWRWRYYDGKKGKRDTTR